MRNLLLAALFVSTLFIACSPNNVSEDNSLKTYFNAQKLEGSFGMFDNGQGNFKIYNLARFRDSAYLPAGTFTIVNKLIGIQTGRLDNEKDTLSAPISKDTIQHWLDTLGYAAQKGRAIIKSDSFWLNNSIKITADEQLGLVKKLYFNQLPFFARTQQLVIKSMLKEDNANYKLSYELAIGITPKGHALGWLIGWIEENKHPYFFVLQLESTDKNKDLSAPSITILKEILKQYGFMEGKK